VTGGRRAGAGSTSVGLAGEGSASEIFLQVLVRSFSETCTVYTAKVLSSSQYSWQVAYRSPAYHLPLRPRPQQMPMERLLKS
jgi:hypothetical protein